VPYTDSYRPSIPASCTSGVAPNWMAQDTVWLNASQPCFDGLSWQSVGHAHTIQHTRAEASHDYLIDYHPLCKWRGCNVSAVPVSPRTLSLAVTLHLKTSQQLTDTASYETPSDSLLPMTMLPSQPHSGTIFFKGSWIRLQCPLQRSTKLAAHRE